MNMFEEVNLSDENSASLFEKYCSKLEPTNLNIVQDIEDVEEYVKTKIHNVDGLEKLTIINGLFNDFKKDESYSILDMDE